LKGLKAIVTSMGSVLKKYSPEILTGLGIAGMVASTILAVKATPKALTLINEKKEEMGVAKLNTQDTVKTAWKCYIPSLALTAVSAICIVGASASNARRNAALATAYTISENALREYQNKVIETVGEKKETEIRDSVAKDKIDKTPVSSEVIVTEKGNTLCYDTLSGRYFRSDIDKIKRAVIEINFKIIDEVYASLNEFYDELELPHTKMGDDLGWNVIDGRMDIHFSSHVAADGNPCLVLNYRAAPRYDYMRR